MTMRYLVPPTVGIGYGIASGKVALTVGDSVRGPMGQQRRVCGPVGGAER